VSAEKNIRYEVKMVAQAAAYDRVRMFMRADRSGLRVLYPPRIVQSVYFDTWRDRALEENLSGVSHREKIRFRWYGDAKTDVKGVLERKVRENMLGWKDFLPIDEVMQVEGASRTEFARRIFAHLTPSWHDVRAMALQPVQWIRYEREYFSSGRIRVTVDRKLRTWDQRYRRTITSAFRTPTPNVVIVEAKCAQEDYDELQAMLVRFPLFVDKCSKFVFASDPGEGALISRITG
jgi:hypothetical protein